MTTKRGRRGFTLIELMVTVVIVAILAAVAVASFTKFKRSARKTEGIAAINDIRMKQEAFYNTYSRYVSSTTDEDDFSGSWVDSGDAVEMVDWDEPACPDTSSAWCNLGFTHPPFTRLDDGTDATWFRYQTIGWAPGAAAPSMIEDPTQRWLVIRAVGLPNIEGDNGSFTRKDCTRLWWTNETNEVLTYAPVDCDTGS
ncbi:MAG: prepilin-type N-terminal cleavage/methylation domain-containing protein [Deltaproteobacteria bacterium]|nr:prepilin-type N-terminal cleavage/methylation domain-containing protein [Deltaproteobacteria bacterium]